MVNHYNNNYVVQGNSGIPEYPDDPDFNFDDDPDNDINYINVDDQYFYNYTSGINDKFNFSFATLYKEIVYMGASMAFHHIDFYQNTVFEESSNDGEGNTMDVRNVEYLSTYASGFQFWPWDHCNANQRAYVWGLPINHQYGIIYPKDLSKGRVMSLMEN